MKNKLFFINFIIFTFCQHYINGMEKYSSEYQSQYDVLSTLKKNLSEESSENCQNLKSLEESAKNSHGWEKKLKLEHVKWAENIINKKEIPVGIDMALGGKENQEDDFAYLLPCKENPTYAFFGIFDGHSREKKGDQVSNFLANNLFRNIIKNDVFTKGIEDGNSEDIKSAIKDGFLKTDKELYTNLQINKSGSTAVILMLAWLKGKQKCFVANVGDSIAHVVKNSKIKQLSIDHNAKNKNEKERIIKCRGSIIMGRVQGAIAITRGFGHRDGYGKNGVIPDPEIIEYEPEEADNMFMLGSDGVFYEDSLEKHNEILKQKNKNIDPMLMAARLLDLHKYSRRTEDNKSILVINHQEVFKQMQEFQNSKK